MMPNFMALATGSRLGPYEILALVGSGGMGEVYRARDAKLGRDVALKVLPEAFARDAERMARFQREAKVLASLNHPNIATIHGLEDSGATHALVMELVEGPTLADRIKSGPIPISEALPIAKQICEALEYAHERGIVHRDLKPANVKVTNDDAVKVLDFGLAKALEGDASSIDIANSPTVSRMATQAGVLLGTAAYMSPEQAKGKAVDRRADIWAFGCVLYEMLTGQMAFRGESVTDTLAAVIRAEPDWSRLPAGTPIRVRVLLQRCLQKDPKQRLRDIGDARISLDEVLAGAPEPSSGAAARPTNQWPLWLVSGVAVVFVLAFSALAFVHFREKPVAPAQVLRYQISPPQKTSFGTALALSPDGRHLAFTATAQDGRTRLWVRDLDSLDSRPLPGTEDANYPFWSPDSRVLGFTTGNKLERVDISGGASPQTISDLTGGYGGSWNQDGVIVFGGLSGILRVSAAGGTPSLVTKVDTSRGEVLHGFPSFLPDGRRFLYFRYLGAAVGTYVGSLDAGPEQPSAKPLVAVAAIYAPASGPGPGHILFGQNDTLMAQAFDTSRLELEGDPAPIVQQVTSATVSANGVLAYTGGITAPMQLTWFDRQGKTLGTLGEPGVSAGWPAISPDGSAVVTPREEGGGLDLWLYNLARGTRSRLTFDGKTNGAPVWSPDGSHIAFVSGRDGGINIYRKAINGVGQDEALDKTPASLKVPLDWSRDGRYLIEGVLSSGKPSIWVLPLSPEQAGGDRRSFPYGNDQFSEVGAKVSPNGQWLAYASDETGRFEIYVKTFPKPGGRWPVSINGGTRSLWSRDGKELYFIGLDGKLMAVDVKSGPGGSFEAGTPKALFDPHIGGGATDWFDVSKNGRFLIPVVVEQSGAPITVVVNWTAGLNK
jgi:eukaryotic-like serine/threonine-protein kinase